MKADWLVDKELPWEVIGVVYENGKLVKIRLRKRNDLFNDPAPKATIRILDGKLHAEQDRGAA